MADTFPILSGKSIKAVPWALAEEIRRQAYHNHGQSLERLAERGGLSPLEFLGAARGLDWGQLTPLARTGEDMEAALTELCEAKHREHHK